MRGQDAGKDAGGEGTVRSGENAAGGGEASLAGRLQLQAKSVILTICLKYQ
jgi:hypothetical protein